LSGKDALKIKGIGQGMADRVSPKSPIKRDLSLISRLMSGSMEIWDDSITRITNKFRLYSFSRMFTVSVCSSGGTYAETDIQVVREPTSSTKKELGQLKTSSPVDLN
jgi:hypothetical protein